MNEKLKAQIFSHFDQNGIAGHHLGKISFTINLEESINEPYNSQTIFKPYLFEFDLNDDELEETIIDYVFKTTNIKINSVNELMKMRQINGKPFFLLLNEHDRTKIKYCLAFGRIPGSVIFRDRDKIETLGNIEEINGDLGFSDSNIKDLGKLRRVEGSIWIAQPIEGVFTNLKSLQELEYVGGDLSIKNSNIENLGKLKYVGGNLNLRKTIIKDLGNVEYVGGNLFLPKELKGEIDTTKAKIVGKVKYFDDRSLKSIL